MAGSGVGEHEFADGGIATDDCAAAEDTHGIAVGGNEIQIQFGEGGTGGFELLGAVNIAGVDYFEVADLLIVFEQNTKIGGGGAGENAGQFEIAHGEHVVDDLHIDGV